MEGCALSRMVVKTISISIHWHIGPRRLIQDYKIDIFLIFLRKQVLTFHANCLHGDNLHEMSKPVSCKNSEKYFKMLSAEIFTQSDKC